MADRQPRRWTSAEDQVLREQIDAQQAQGISRDWCQAALALPGRTNKDCRKRWHNSIAEGLRKGQWSRSEDQLLTHGVHRYGPQWTKVATCIDSRSADQCAKRWQQSLDPRLDRSEWREREDADLLVAVEHLGRHWKNIQERYLPHRSKNCIKNRYSVLARRNATKSTLYDDSVGSSSSDPGTPLRQEVNPSLAFTSGLSLYDVTQTSDGSTRSPHAGNDSIMPTWSNLSDPNDFLAADHPSFYDATLVEAHTSFYPNQVLPSTTDDWNHMQTPMSLQQPMHFFAAPSTPYQSFGYPSHTEPSAPLSGPYTASSAPAIPSYDPATQSSRQLPQQERYRQYRKDSAPFGWPPQ